MLNRDTAVRLVTEALVEVNRTLDADRELSAAEDSVLVGDGAPLDSLGLINLIVALEARVQETCGVEIGLIEAAGMNAEQSPFRTVRTLVDYLAEQI